MTSKLDALEKIYFLKTYCDKKYFPEETRIHLSHVEHGLMKHRSNVIMNNYYIHYFYQPTAIKSSPKLSGEKSDDSMHTVDV